MQTTLTMVPLCHPMPYFYEILACRKASGSLGGTSVRRYSQAKTFVAISASALDGAVGALAGDRLSARAQTTAIVTGNLVIFVFAIVILLR